MIWTEGADHECEAPPPAPVREGGIVINFILKWLLQQGIDKNYKWKIRNIEKHQGKNMSLYKFILFSEKKLFILM